MLDKKLPDQKYLIMDSNSVTLGLRRLIADIAWIQLLQYYGSNEKETEEPAGGPAANHKCDAHGHCDYGDSASFGTGKYYDFLKLSQRIVRSDPYFFYPYLYSSASLAWNMDRPEQALALLKEGIDNPKLHDQPQYWQLSLYSSAILFKMSNRVGDMVFILDQAVKQPGCPMILKWILANIYKKNKDYVKAINLFLEISNSDDSMYKDYAEKQILSIKNQSGIN
jgi:tetratricopeptide (TPR) repeat protein